MKASISHKKVKSSAFKGYGEQIMITYRSLDINEIEQIRDIISKHVSNGITVDIPIDKEEKLIKQIVKNRETNNSKGGK